MYYGDPFSYGPRPRVVPLVPVRAPSPATDEVKGHVLWCKTEKHPTKEEIQKAKYHKAYRVFDKDNDGLEFTVHVVHPLPSNCAEIVALEGQKTFDKLASEFRNDVKRYVRKDNLEQARKVYKSLERMAEEAKDKFGRKIAMGKSPEALSDQLDAKREAKNEYGGRSTRRGEGRYRERRYDYN